MEIKQIFVVFAVAMLTLAGHSAKAQDTSTPVVRIAELEIDPAQMEAYSAAVKVEMKTSIRAEPGVLALYAVSIKGKPNHLRFFEMYADNAAYEAHRDSAHFRTYVAITKDMILDRKLFETDNFQLSAKQP